LSMKLIFQNHWIKRAFPAYQVRFGLREQLRFKMFGHGQREDLPPEKVGALKESLLHYSFNKGWTDWFEKHNRYSTAEARENVRAQSKKHKWNIRSLCSLDAAVRLRALKEVSSRSPARPLVKFLYMYFVRRAFLDGRAGFQYCLLLAIYEFMIVLKADELCHKKELSPAQDAPPRESVPQMAPLNGMPETTAAAAHEPSHA
jgi:hypothetical protein